MIRIDLTGQRFGRLTVRGRAGTKNGKIALWSCVCDCGRSKIASGISMRAGHTMSCGCLARETAAETSRIHGMTGTKVHTAWCSILYRCNNPRAKAFKNYGGRGIGVAFESFQDFYNEIGDPPTAKHTVERIDNERGYEPGNVCWATMRRQRRNSRANHSVTRTGSTHIITDWAKTTGLPKSTILSRLTAGKSPEEALAPVIKGTQSLTFDGKTLTIKEWESATGIPEDVIRMRMFRKWPVSKILTQIVRPTTPLTLTHNGVEKTICEWIAETGIPRKALEHRIRRGWPVERILDQPIRIQPGRPRHGV